MAKWLDLGILIRLYRNECARCTVIYRDFLFSGSSEDFTQRICVPIEDVDEVETS
jgi:hypothetical protein